MSERTVALNAVEAMLVKLAAERRQQAERVAQIEFEAAIKPVMDAHGKTPSERADIRGAADASAGQLVIVFTEAR